MLKKFNFIEMYHMGCLNGIVKFPGSILLKQFQQNDSSSKNYIEIFARKSELKLKDCGEYVFQQDEASK